MKKILAIAIILTVFVACNNAQEDVNPTEPSGTISTKVKVTTDFGDMVIGLYDETPLHRDNFVKLVEEGFYDSLIFHRIIKNFMIQGGDPGSKNATMEQPLGAGGPGYQIPAEIIPGLLHKKGALAAARQSDQANPRRESSGSQFYIVQGKTADSSEMAQNLEKITFDKKGVIARACSMDPANKPLFDKMNEYQQTNNKEEFQKLYDEEFIPLIESEYAKSIPFTYSQEELDIYATVGGAPFLDQQYTIFGEIISGLNVVDSIAIVQTGQGDRPTKDIRMYMEIVK